ncbi:MAG: flagellar biosynthetic protein FliO [Treponema sp.]|nr:flagellar biosynthetic protein FliO [Treponema sp.]
MGGEKLKRIYPAFAFLCAAAILFTGISRLSAQEQGQSLDGTGGVLSSETLSLSETAAAPPAAGGTGDTAQLGAAAARSAEAEIILGEAFPGDTPANSGITGNRLFAVIRMVLVLALAAAAVYGVVFFLRRSARPQNERNSQLKILTSAHLGSNRYVYVVNVGARAWLVGAGEGGVSLISEVTDQEAIDAMILEESKRGAELAASRFADFRAMLARFTARPSPGVAGETHGHDASPFSAQTLRKQRERSRGL